MNFIGGEPDRRRARAVPALVIVLILFAALTAAALAASTNFTEPNTSPEVVGDSPFAAAAGDLDGDGDTDLAVANLASDNVTVLKNGGSANFNEPASSPESAGDAPRSIAIADFDGDTDQDLAVANSGSANVTVLRNIGSGNFTPATTSPEVTGGGPSSIVAADLDGDGDSDLATANASSSNVTVLRNVGGGDFVQPSSSPEPAGSQAFATSRRPTSPAPTSRS
jgi:FG-GAP-like repeat/FG-GAP repeat